MSSDRTIKTGSCLCGAVAYEVSGPLRQAFACHCGMCRKSGGNFIAFTNAGHKDFKLTEERGLKWYQASEGARRGFCGECGGSLFFEVLGADRISIAAGTLDGETGLKTVGHIFVADKGDYYTLDDQAPRYPQGDDTVPMPD